MTPKQLFAAGALVGILAVGGASIASAQDSGSTTTPDSSSQTTPSQSTPESVDSTESVDGTESVEPRPELPEHGAGPRVDGNDALG